MFDRASPAITILFPYAGGGATIGGGADFFGGGVSRVWGSTGGGLGGGGRFDAHALGNKASTALDSTRATIRRTLST